MRYGHFDDERREYVITRPDTPLPWINYLGSEDYFALLSNTAGGYSFFRDARLRRLIRYRYNNAPLDVGGRFLYVRDDDTGDYWNPGWQPMQRELDDYTCRHGLGYSVIAGSRGGIRVETTYLVPPGETLEVWRARVTNDRPTAARVSLFGAVEFCLWDAQDDATNFQRNLSTGEVLVEDGVIYHLTEYRERRDHFAWFACSAPVAGFDTSREAFLGAYRGWDRPLAWSAARWAARSPTAGSRSGPSRRAWSSSRGIARGHLRPRLHGEPGGAQVRPARLRPPDTATARAVIDRYRRPGRSIDDLAALRAAWDERLGTLQVATGNEHVDRMVNTWNPYQCMVTFNLSRSASMFESGIGRGMGFRDSNQDLLGFVHMVPERARARILDIAATQLPDGGAYHQYQPLTKRGNHDVGSGFNDDPAWLVLGVAAYLKETGDLSILDEPVLGQRRRLRDAAPRPPAAVHRVHPRAAGPARAAAHRTGRLERLPQPQRLLRPARRILPDGPQPPGRRCRVGVHRRRCSCSPHGRRRRSRACAATRRRRPAASAARRDDRVHRGARLGWGLVPAGVRPRRAARRIGRQRRGPDLHRAPGDDGDGGRGPGGRAHADRARLRPGAAGDAPRDRAPAAGLRELPPRAGRDLLVPARLQGERRGLLPHEPVDDDRRGDHRQRGGCARLLPAHQPLGPRGDLATCTAASRTSTRR